jgi:hypothetical protein
VASVVGFYLACAFCIFNDHYSDKRKTRFIKSLLMILFILIAISFECLVIWKLVLSYKIKKSGVRWFMVMDYFFIFLNLFYIIFIFVHTKKYFEESGAHVAETIDIYVLTLFNGINILHYILPGNFEDLNEKERKKIILQNCKKFEYDITDKQKVLIKTINTFRDENNIPQLKFDKVCKIPEFIFEKPSEMILFPEEDIFKISKKKFIFKYPIGEFEQKFKNNDKIL